MINERKTCPEGWTVILIYPDYLQESTDGVPDSFVEHCPLRSKAAAIREIQRRAATQNDVNDPDDFAVLGVMRGYVRVYAP